MIIKMNKYWTENKIGAEGAMKISELLMKNTTLTQLYLYGDGKIIQNEITNDNKNDNKNE